MDELLNNYSPTYEALSIIYESMESESDTFKCFMSTGLLMESGYSSDIIMESVNDIFKSIVEGIKKFITKIKDFFKRILLYITSSFQDLDKLANEVKKVINDKDIKFDVDGYDFTVVDKPNPDMSEFQNIVNNYNTDMSNLQSLKIKDVKDDITEWLDEKNINKLRGDVLGVNKEISDTDFLQEIRDFYRNGESNTHTINVTKSYVNEIINKAKKLEDAKRASIKDRDKIIELLTKTEKFFDRNIQSYYSGSKKMVDVDKISTDDNKFSKTSNRVEATDDNVKNVSIYASYKSKQVNKIASMINLVMCEKVNALKDQISQERNILKKCLFGNKKEPVQDAMELNPDNNLKVTQYDIISLESSIHDYHLYSELSRDILLEESKFILDSLNTGVISPVTEADTTKLAGKIKESISNMIERLVKAFRQKAIGNTDKYTPWIEDIKEGIIEKAKNKKEFTMSSFDDANYTKMVRDMSASMSEAYQSTDYTSGKFASRITNAISTLDQVKNTSRSELLLNYFRTGKADEKLAKKTLNGNQLAGKVQTMMDYITKYGTDVTKPSEQLTNSMKSASASFKVQESLSGSTFLSLLGCPICESDLSLCRDYNMIFSPVTETYIMEADGIGGNNKSAISGTVNKQMKSDQGAAKAETNNAKETTASVTGVSSTDKENPDNPTGEEGTKKSNNEASTYRNIVDDFFKKCVSLYLKAREEQFIMYVHALSDIDGEPPKFDENGKYIPKAERKKNKKDTEEK